MAKRTIVTMPGDGIGKVVLEESLRVLEAPEFPANVGMARTRMAGQS